MLAGLLGEILKAPGEKEPGVGFKKSSRLLARQEENQGLPVPRGHRVTTQKVLPSPTRRGLAAR